MPTFGLGDALKAVIEGAGEAKVMRPAERALVNREAAKVAAPKSTAPGPLETTAPTPAMPKANIPAPEPPPPVAAQAPADAPPDPAAAQPAPEAVVADTSGAQPTSAGPTTSDDVLRPADAPPPADPANPTAPPDGAPGPARPQSVASEPIAPDSRLQAERPPEPIPGPGDDAIRASAQRFVKANLGDFNLNDKHLPNIKVMTSPDDVKAAILQVADDNKANIDVARRGTISDEQMAGLAADIPGGTPSVIRQVLGRELGANVDRPEIALAARQVEQTTAGTLQALAERVASGKASSADLVDYEQQRQFLVQFNAQLAGAKAESGRTQRVLGLPLGTDQRAVDHAAEILRLNDSDKVREAKAIKMALSPLGIAQIAEGSLMRRTAKASMGLINRIFANGILSGPPTWIKIGLGNTFNTALNAGDLFAAAAVGKFMSGAEHATVGEAVANLHGTISAFSDGLRMAGRVAKTGESLDSVMRYKEGAPRGDTMYYLPELSPIGSVVKFVDQVIDAPGSRAVGAIDEFSKTLGYRGYTERMAYRAMQDAFDSGKLKQADAAQFVQDFMQNPTPEVEQAAEAWAHRMSFQDPLGPIGQAAQDLMGKAPILRLIVPFMRTSINIFKQWMGDRTPLGLFANRMQQTLAAGGPERDIAIARMLTGTAIGAATARMAFNGDLSGPGPQDAKSRALWQADGTQPYSIRIRNPLTGESTWHSYANFEPVASIIGAVAESVEIGHYVYANDESDTMLNNDQKWNDAVAHIVVGIVNNTGNKTFMQGIAQFSEMWADPQRGFASYVQHFVPSLVPYSGMQKFIRNESDPYLRQAHTIMDQIKNNTPGYSRELPTEKDIFGEDRQKSSGSLLGIMSPMPDKPDNFDTVTKEILDVMNDTRTVPVTMPDRRIGGGGSGKGVQGAAGMRLTDSEYADLVNYSRSEPLANGLNFHDTLEKLIESSVYQSATPAMRAELLMSVQHSADESGRARLAQDPDFAERMSQWIAQKNQQKFNR